ncbi:uncharacterized protein LOC103568717 [Microplitis demolitor]|uniref:uncharacterized protein LOC103568717 n=1 Tax=Microplitis demolitor TaxID=69319 RepID=UPI0004CD4944|nr:uncharacterized protein LOC103568717 [Microplitis demolitor]
MGLNPLTWKFRTLIYILAIVFFYIFFIFKKVHHVVVEVTIENARPVDVWEYVADFSNVKKLNPTIENFNIIDETGNLDHWKYSVHYKEHLSQFPSIRNTAQGHYSIKPDGNGFVINSDHRTCFFTNYDCVNSKSSFKFIPDGRNTKCIEYVDYECPIAFSKFCYNEVMFQRNEIMNGLQRHFHMRNRQNNENRKQ